MSPSEHSPFYPTSRPYRFIILAFAALMAFGSYFAYDSVGAIETTLIQVFHTDRAAIGAMYTMYSVALSSRSWPEASSSIVSACGAPA
jgi:hypothetical protein